MGSSVAVNSRPDNSGRQLGRILHVTTRHVLGGGARNLNFTLTRELRSGYEVHVAVGDEHPVAVPQGVHLHVLPALHRKISPQDDLVAYRQLRRLIRANAYDMVHTHQSKAGIVGRLAARDSVPVLAHTIHMASFGAGYPAVQSLAFQTLERYCARFTDLFLAVGEDLKHRYLSAGIGHDAQYLVVRSPINVHRAAQVRTSTDADRAACRTRLGLPPSVAVIASAGLLEGRKRIDLMIRRLASLLNANPELMLAIAGSGPQDSRLKSLSEELGLESKIRFLGWLDDLSDLLAVASVFVLTSSVEGVPQVVIQALAAGVPVVATDVEGIHEVAGAPVSVVDRQGRGLAEACSRVLDGPGRPAVPVDQLSEWTEESVAEGLSEFHARARDLVIAKSGPLRA